MSIVLAVLLATTGSAIPPAFHGTWYADVSECDPALDPQVLDISEQDLRFYEWTGEVVRVSLVSPREIIVDANMNEHGDTWSDTFRYQLSANEESLTEEHTGNAAIIRYRCVANEKKHAPNN